MDALSRREREVYHLVVKGLLVKQIAFDLGISHQTVSTYKRRLKEKLGLETDNAVVKHYYKQRELKLCKLVRQNSRSKRFDWSVLL